MMSLNQARIVTTILTGLVLFAEVNIPDWNAKANPSQPKAATLSTAVPITPPKLRQKDNITQLQVALQHLKVAQSELENLDDKDNSRATALKETNKAIAEIEMLLKSDPKRSIAKSSKPDNCNT
jgi:septal ring factor EnvC (AmiA/AmiB activator)